MIFSLFAMRRRTKKHITQNTTNTYNEARRVQNLGSASQPCAASLLSKGDKMKKVLILIICLVTALMLGRGKRIV